MLSHLYTDTLLPRLSKLGFGFMRLPKLADGTTDREQTAQMVDAYLASGGNYFDTARAYGESEQVLRETLVKRHPRGDYYVATKVAPWMGAASAAEARAMFETSLVQTGLEYFDCYLLHNVGDNRTRVFDQYGMWEFLEGLKRERLVRRVGFSFHDNAASLERTLEAHPFVDFVQLQVNYADWENSSTQSRACCEVARRHGKPIVVMEPVRGGTLAQPPQPVADILREASPSMSFPEWALRFAMGVEGVACVLSGMSSLAQMEDNLRIWEGFQPLDGSQLAAIDRAQQKLAEIIEVNCTACRYCVKGCPMRIDIPNFMQTLNRNRLYGVADGRKWYNIGTASGQPLPGECIGCGQCEEVCPQHIPIIEKLAKVSAIYDGA